MAMRVLVGRKDSCRDESMGPARRMSKDDSRDDDQDDLKDECSHDYGEEYEVYRGLLL